MHLYKVRAYQQTRAHPNDKTTRLALINENVTRYVTQRAPRRRTYHSTRASKRGGGGERREIGTHHIRRIFVQRDAEQLLG